MFRRSRFSVRPNVGTAGRTAAAPQEAPAVNQEASETPKDVSESSTAPVTDIKSVVTPSEKSAASGDGNDQNGEGSSSSAALQRRKRFSVKPKVAPGRPATLARTPKSPAKAASQTPVEVPGSDHDKPTTSGQTAAPQGLRSPRRRRLSEDSKQPQVQPKPTLISSDSSGTSAVPPAEDRLEQTHLPADSSKQLESTSGSQVKEVPSRLPDKVPPSLPDKEANEISEKAKTLVSSKGGLTLSPPEFSLSRLLNDPSDLQRIAKARKLRELLRQEMHKEKKMKKAKARTKEYTLDPAKMTMRDLIRYLPLSNPMTSSLEDPAPENETIVPPSPGREESPERAQEPQVPPKVASPREEEEEEEEVADEEQEEALMVPQVKVAEDGSLIIDEESLTVEVQRTKGPNPAQDRDPIFERGSTTTYSSFRKGTYSKPWSSEETDMFFLAISMVGTDFSMICQLFPHRARSEIKNKFKKEERENAWRIDKAFRERRKLDIEYFSKLLEKILEVQKNKKKLKSVAEKKSPKKHKRKAKGKKAARNLSDVEEGDEEEEEENEIPDLEEEEGEKENEDLCNEGGATVSKPKKKRKRKKIQDASTEEPTDKKNKTGSDEAYIPEDTEAALPEDHTNSDLSEKTENANTAKDTAIKPAKLSRGRAPKPLLPLGRKWGKKLPPPSTKVKDTASDRQDESVTEGASEEQVNKDASPVSQDSKRKSANDDISSEEEVATVQPPRPTRYGRVPKPTKPLTYSAKDDAQSSSSETTPASPAASTASAVKPKAKCTAKRGRPSKQQSAQESKKPKLVTLRASQSEYSDEESEKQWEEEEVEEEQHPACSSGQDSIAPAFVPASLRSPHPMISEVEETMEELDILANMPDVLGISQDALCPDASCELAQNETGTAEPCENQLDLLVDVIDFLSSEHTEVSEEESYNEAAQTLLTIGNLAHISQSAQNQTAVQDHTTGASSVSVDETSQHIEVEIASKPAAQEENSATPHMSATHGQGVTETSETVDAVVLQNSTTDSGDMPIVETSDQITVTDLEPTHQLQSSPERPKTNPQQTRRGRLSKVKPKVNLGQSSRTAQSKSKPETSTVRTGEDTDAPNLSQAAETVAEETTQTADFSQNFSKDEISCIEVKLEEEPPVSQERFIGCVQSSAATSDHSASENQSHFSGAQFEPSLEEATRESTDETLMSHVGTTKSTCNNLVTSDTAVTESKIGQGTNTDSAPVQQSTDHPAPCVPPAEDLPVLQKEESRDASTHQTRKSRFQKVKPKPKLTQTSRIKPQTTKDPVEKDSNPTPNPKLHEKTIVEVEAEPTCTTSSEKPSQSSAPASDLMPSLDFGSTLTPTEQLSTTEEKKTDVGVVCQVESGSATSDQSASAKAQFEPSGEQANRDTRPTSESGHDKLISHAGTSESSCSNPLPSDSAVPESQVGQESKTDTVQKSSDHPAPCVTEESPVSQKGESEVASTCPTRRGQLRKVKPNLPQTSRTVRSKPQTTKDPVTHVPLVEEPSSPTSRPESTDSTTPGIEAQPTCSPTPPGKQSQIESTDSTSLSVPSLELCSIHKPAEESSLAEGQKTDFGNAPDSSSEGSEQNVPQRRRRFPKMKPKPNLGSTKRTTQTKLQSDDISKPSEQHHMDTSSAVSLEQQAVDRSDAGTEKDSKHLTPLHTELLSSTKAGPAESEKSLNSTEEKGTSSDGVIKAASSVADKQSVFTDSVLENKSSEKPADESTGDKVETGPASRWHCQQNTSVRATETNTQPTDDPTAISDVPSSEDGSTESKIKSANTQSTSDPKESALQPHSENDSEAQSQIIETTPTAAQSTDDNESKSTGSTKSTRKTPQTRRGRLPNLNLGRSCQPPQPQQVQNIKQAEADSSPRSEGVDDSVSHKPVSEHRPDIHEPGEGAIEQHSNQTPTTDDAGSSMDSLPQVIEQMDQRDSSSNVAGSSLGFVTQAPDNSSKDASTSSTGGTQTHPSLSIFPGMLLEQVPSDPDEPFFILSLTEIPVCSSGEVVGSVSEPLPYLPVADVSVQQQSNIPGDGSAAAGDGPLSNVAVSMEESGETGLISVKDIGPDPAAFIQGLENPVDPHESTSVQPSILPETNEETERPPTKQRQMGTGRRVKLQVKPKTQRRKQAGKTLAAKEAESIPTQDSELPGPSVQPKAFGEVVTEPRKGSGDHADIEKETLTDGKDPGAQTTQTMRTSSQDRKPKSFPSFLSETNTPPSSDSPTASEGPEGTTPHVAAKQSTPAPVASTSCDVAPALSPTPDVSHTTPSTTSPTQAEADVELTSVHSRLRSDPTPSSPCTAEVSASQRSDGVESSSIEEEPTSVSQYFLSDIFTDVEEG